MCCSWWCGLPCYSYCIWQRKIWSMYEKSQLLLLVSWNSVIYWPHTTRFRDSHNHWSKRPSCWFRVKYGRQQWPKDIHHRVLCIVSLYMMTSGGDEVCCSMYNMTSGGDGVCCSMWNMTSGGDEMCCSMWNMTSGGDGVCGSMWDMPSGGWSMLFYVKHDI